MYVFQIDNYDKVYKFIKILIYNKSNKEHFQFSNLEWVFNTSQKNGYYTNLNNLIIPVHIKDEIKDSYFFNF